MTTGEDPSSFQEGTLASEGRAPMLTSSLMCRVLGRGLFWAVRREGGWEKALLLVRKQHHFPW